MFGLKQLPPIDAAPPIDAFACITQTIHDDFSGSAPCDDWGSPTSIPLDAGVSGNGMFVITPVANTGSQGGCIARAPVAFGGGGLFVKVAPALDPLHESGMTGGTFLFFRTTAVTSGDVALTISEGGSQIDVAVTGSPTTTSSTPYDPVAMLWWRIRPDVGAVVAETSPDGFTWQPLATVAGPVPVSVGVEFTAGEYAVGIPDPGTAVFEDFNICP